MVPRCSIIHTVVFMSGRCACSQFHVSGLSMYFKHSHTRPNRNKLFLLEFLAAIIRSLRLTSSTLCFGCWLVYTGTSIGVLLYKISVLIWCLFVFSHCKVVEVNLTAAHCHPDKKYYKRVLWCLTDRLQLVFPFVLAYSNPGKYINVCTCTCFHGMHSTFSCSCTGRKFRRSIISSNSKERDFARLKI